VFAGALAAAAISGPSPGHSSSTQPGVAARNVVLVHGLFADGSCWSDVIIRLQAAGLNATAVQNPLTTLDESVAAARNFSIWPVSRLRKIIGNYGWGISGSASAPSEIRRSTSTSRPGSAAVTLASIAAASSPGASRTSTEAT
jgi:hypothetical protein